MKSLWLVRKIGDRAGSHVVDSSFLKYVFCDLRNHLITGQQQFPSVHTLQTTGKFAGSQQIKFAPFLWFMKVRSHVINAESILSSTVHAFWGLLFSWCNLISWSCSGNWIWGSLLVWCSSTSGVQWPHSSLHQFKSSVTFIRSEFRVCCRWNPWRNWKTTGNLLCQHLHRAFRLGTESADSEHVRMILGALPVRSDQPCALDLIN